MHGQEIDISHVGKPHPIPEDPEPAVPEQLPGQAAFQAPQGQPGEVPQAVQGDTFKRALEPPSAIAGPNDTLKPIDLMDSNRYFHGEMR